MNNATQPSDGKSQSAEESKKAIWSWETVKSYSWKFWNHVTIFFSWIKTLPLWIRKSVLCPATCFLNLFFVASLTLGLVYGYYAMYDNSADVNRTNVKLCIDNKEIPQEQESKIQCCNGSDISCNGNGISCNGNGITYGLCKVVEKTTQATIILMLVVLAFLSLEVYCKYKSEGNNKTGENQKEENGENQKERRNNVITVLIATLGASAIPTGISLIICAFYDMKWMQFLSGVEAYIAFAGISIIAIAFLSVSDEEKGNLRTDRSLNDMQKGSKS